MTSIAEPNEASAPAESAVPAKADGRFLLVVLQLLLLLAVVRLFHVEERRGLFALLVLATMGALVHCRLPLQWRPLFFLLVSLVSFPLALAWPSTAELGWNAALVSGLQQTGWVLAIGLVLIAACHVPIRFAVRVVLLVAIAAGLIIWRADALSPFWAVLGSIFMFRLWIYLKALRRERERATWPQRLSYFFLFSNGFFPFFPIVDYRKFRNSYVADDNGLVMQRGIGWIVHGIVQILLYRVVMTFFLPGPMDLIDLEYLALFLVTNYALYMRISGHFHIICGLLHLFGYALPRTHDRYFLASSLSDIWRRINIYWKDFLTEHVFFPAFFALRRLPKAAAVVAGVLVTFVVTWFLHSWQVFWLVGNFPLHGRDAALWLSAGTLVAINSLWQYRRALRPQKEQGRKTLGQALLLSVQVAGTFLTVSFFWACWTMPYFPRLVAAVAGSGGFPAHQIMTVGAILLGVIAAGTAVQLMAERLSERGIRLGLPLERSPAACAVVLGLLVVVGLPDVQGALGPAVSPKLAALATETRTARALGQEVDAYYEELAEVNLQADPLLDTASSRKARTVLYWDATQQRNDALGTELIPGWRGEVQGVAFQVNRWGMRDDDLPRRKPSETYRIAVLGSSVTMGYGVAADADFETLLERRLNDAVQPGGPRIELLNFAVGGYYALHSAIALREKGLQFAPDAALYIAHQGEYYGPAKHLALAYKAGHVVPYPCLSTIIEHAGVTETTPWGSAELMLRTREKEIVACTYRGMAEDCRRSGVLPIWAYVPMPGVAGFAIDAEELKGYARNAGFVVIDLSGWANGYEPRDLKFDHDQHHANELGHRIIAVRLFAALQQHPEALPILANHSSSERLEAESR